MWKFNFGKYRFPHITHWGAFGVWQAVSGVSTMLLCEEKMHFWKETTRTFQTWVPHTELSTSSVVAGDLLLFRVGLEPRKRPAPLCHIFKARHPSEAAEPNHSCVVALGHTQIHIILYVCITYLWAHTYTYTLMYMNCIFLYFCYMAVKEVGFFHWNQHMWVFQSRKTKEANPASSHGSKVVSNYSHCYRSPLLKDAKKKSWKLRVELPVAFKATCGLVMQSVESFSTESLQAWETNRNRVGRRMHWLVTLSLAGPQNEIFSPMFTH